MSEHNYCGKYLPQPKIIGCGIVDGKWLEYHDTGRYTDRGNFIKVDGNCVTVEYVTAFGTHIIPIHYQINGDETIEQMMKQNEPKN